MTVNCACQCYFSRHTRQKEGWVYLSCDRAVLIGRSCHGHRLKPESSFRHRWGVCCRCGRSFTGTTFRLYDFDHIWRMVFLPQQLFEFLWWSKLSSEPAFVPFWSLRSDVLRRVRYTGLTLHAYLTMIAFRDVWTRDALWWRYLSTRYHRKLFRT